MYSVPVNICPHKVLPRIPGPREHHTLDDTCSSQTNISTWLPRISQADGIIKRSRHKRCEWASIHLPPMKLTSILYVPSWISKLHPPMPTTTKENRQLLSLLGSSFQRQLDEAHPPIQSTEPPHRQSMPISGPAVDNTSARATKNHLQSLLQHPVLCRKEVNYRKPIFAAANAATMIDQAMLGGEVNLDALRKCMRSYIQTSPRQGPVIMDKSHLGRKVSAWFTSSSAATKKKFLSSPGILASAVPILYADGLEEDVWEWLRMLYAGSLDTSNIQQYSDRQLHAKHLQRILQEIHLTFLMIREALRRRRLDAAILHFIHACGYMQRTGRMSPQVRSSQPWLATTKTVTMALLGRRYQHRLSAHTYDCFLQHHSLWSSSSAFAFELVCLYHPLRPSAKELVAAVSQANDQVEALFDQVKAMDDRTQKVVLKSLLDGAQFLLEQNPSSASQAKLILHLAEQQFPQFADADRNEAPQRRIGSVRHTITPYRSMPTAAIGIT
jgi:hypothetical protein